MSQLSASVAVGGVDARGRARFLAPMAPMRYSELQGYHEFLAESVVSTTCFPTKACVGSGP